MRKIKILSKKEIKAIKKKIFLQYGAECELDYVFLRNQKDKLYIANKEVFEIPEDRIRIDSLGIYFGTMERTELRLSIEGSLIVGKHATKGMIEISYDDMKKWLKGEEIKTESNELGFILIKHNDDFLGCGRIKDGMLLNYYPKARRIHT